MLKLSFLRNVICLSLMATSYISSNAEVSEEFVVIHCESPGTLVLSEEALLAPNLKVTGNIDARDFNTLKQVTMCTTRALDLSEVIISEYTGTDGTASSPGNGGWMIRSGEEITYPANTFPTGALSEWRYNSVYHFCEGTETLARLILPATLESFMEGSFISNSILTDLEVPAASTTIRNDNHAVYSYDGSTLLAVAPAWYGHITVPATVKSVAPAAFEAASPASVTFTSAQMPAFSEEAKLNTGYIIAPDPAPYKERFPDIDCIQSLETISVTVSEPDMLMTEIGNKGYSRNEVKAVKVTGSLSYADFEALVTLPFLHYADLSEASVHNKEWQQVMINNASLTDLVFPEFTDHINLRIGADSRLHGHIDVPENTYSFNCSSPRFSSASFPSFYMMTSDCLFPSYSVVERLDFSRCDDLDALNGYARMGRLSTLKLPENLKRINSIYGPVKDINLPASLEYISAGDWLVEKLVLPESVQEIYLYSLPMVKEIDASKATSLKTISGLSHSPNLKHLDLSMCPIVNINFLFGGISTGSLIVSGGSAYNGVSVAAVESVILPPTVQSLNGFTDCPNLKGMDLMQCFRLEKITGFQNCPALGYITLPESVKELYGFINIPALTSVESAAAIAPAYDSGYISENDNPLDFSNISLLVAEGTAGSYRMAEGWEKCKSISDAAYRVSISCEQLGNVTSETKRLILYGAGIYTPGEEATLYGPAYGSFIIKGWEVNKEITESNPCKIKADGNITVAPLYSLDYDKCDLVMTLSANMDVTVPLWVGSATRSIFLDGERLVEYSDTWWNEQKYNINLEEGNHIIAISSPLFSLRFEGDQEDGPDYSVTDFQLNNRETLTTLYAHNFDMDFLDLSGCGNLYQVTSQRPNRISKVDISNCASLDNAHFYDASVEDIALTESPVKDLSLSQNLLSGIDLSSHSELLYLYVDSNRLQSLDITPCSALKGLYAYRNQLKEFKSGSHPELERLYLYENEISELKLDDLPSLTDMDISYNTISGSLDISGYENLKVLNLAGNHIQGIELGEKPNLQTLVLEYNEIGGTLDISGCPALISLNAENNKISDFKYADHPVLEVIFLSENQISHFHGEDFPALCIYNYHSQEFDMSISETDFNISLIDNDGFDPTRITQWLIEGYDNYNNFVVTNCEVDGNMVRIPEEFGRNLVLRYRYLTNPSEEETTEYRINITRDGFGAVDDLIADGLFSVNGSSISFADGISGEIYTPGGMNVFKGTGETPALPSGIYLIRIASSVTKIAIP